MNVANGAFYGLIPKELRKSSGRKGLDLEKHGVQELDSRLFTVCIVSRLRQHILYMLVKIKQGRASTRTCCSVFRDCQ